MPSRSSRYRTAPGPIERPAVAALLVALVAAPVMTGTGCDRGNWQPAAQAEGIAPAGPPAAPGQGDPIGIREPEASLRQQGRVVYRRHCIGCHGDKGDGKGPAARFLNPPPRDFTMGVFKFAGVPAGSLPQDADLHRTLERGLPGTSMPSWRLLPTGQRGAVIAYIKSLSPRWRDERPQPGIVATEDPWADDLEEGIVEGKRVFHARAMCWNCHPAYATYNEMLGFAQSYEVPAPSFRANLYRAQPKPSDWGFPITPPDFLSRADPIKAGTSLQDLYRTIASGVGGTAMPSWREALPEEDLWAMVHYVNSLIALRGTPEATALHQRLLAQGAPPPAAEPATEGDAPAAPATADDDTGARATGDEDAP